MTRTELVERVAEHLGVSVASVERVVTEMIDMIAEAIVSGEPVLIRAFGTLKTQTRAPRTGYDMYHKKSVPIPEHERVIFVTSTTLKRRIEKRKARCDAGSDHRQSPALWRDFVIKKRKNQKEKRR